jgi:hypothetical protein
VHIVQYNPLGLTWEHPGKTNEPRLLYLEPKVARIKVLPILWVRAQGRDYAHSRATFRLARERMPQDVSECRYYKHNLRIAARLPTYRLHNLAIPGTRA